MINLNLSEEDFCTIISTLSKSQFEIQHKMRLYSVYSQEEKLIKLGDELSLLSNLYSKLLKQYRFNIDERK